jgi:hypothetical protein
MKRTILIEGRQRFLTSLEDAKVCFIRFDRKSYDMNRQSMDDVR